jgi:hypothetical protein
MNYTEAMNQTPADFWAMLWPLYVLMAAAAVGRFAKWIRPK